MEFLDGFTVGMIAGAVLMGITCYCTIIRQCTNYIKECILLVDDFDSDVNSTDFSKDSTK